MKSLNLLTAQWRVFRAGRSDLAALGAFLGETLLIAAVLFLTAVGVGVLSAISGVAE